MPRGVYSRNRPEEGEFEPQIADEVPEAALSSRASDERRERRRRDDGDLDRMARLKLAVPHQIREQAQREGKVYRWFLDEPGRMQGAIADDWDIVEDVEPVAAGSETAQKLVLMWKYKDWHVSDEKAEQSSLDEREEAIVSGANPEARSKGLVVPQGQRNRISRERGL